MLGRSVGHLPVQTFGVGGGKGREERRRGQFGACTAQTMSLLRVWDTFADVWDMCFHQGKGKANKRLLRGEESAEEGQEEE